MSQKNQKSDPSEIESHLDAQDNVEPVGETETGIPSEKEEEISEVGAGEEKQAISHEQYVQALALKIFDSTQLLHELPEESRYILSQSALVYDQPYKSGRKKPLRAFRKSLYLRLGETLPPNIDAQLVPILLFQCGRIKRKDIVNLDLSTAQQRSVLSLASILSLAIGLDSSHTQSTSIEHIESGRQVVWIAVDGPQAMRDAAAAQHNARLWEKIGYPKIKVAEASQVLGLFTPQFTVGDKVGIQPIDSMVEAGRKVFRYQFAAMLSNEDGTRTGEDIEHLHDMRVATRRMRAAFDVFGDYYERKTLKTYLK